jgi:hypothetical protein
MASIPQINKSVGPIAILAAVSIFGLLSCGTSNDAGLNLGVSVSPEKAYVVPGKGISCVAQATAKTADTVPTADIDGERILFNHFKIQWRSPNAFTVAQIKLTLFSTGLAGAETTTGKEVILSEEETAALLGLANLTIDYANPYTGPDGQPVDRKIDIDSTSTTIKSSTSAYAPCGLQIGGLATTPGVKTYTARVKIEVLGYMTACDEKNPDGTCLSGIQTPVRQSVTVSAQKY